MDARLVKYISIPIIVIVNFIVGFLPYFLINRRLKKQNRRYSRDNAFYATEDVRFIVTSPKMKRFLSLANFFCAGVFLSMCFIGLYPMVNSKFSSLERQKRIPHYPFSGVTIACGFFLVWLLEIIVHGCLHCRKHGEHHHIHNHSHADSAENNKKVNNTNKNKPNTIALNPLSPTTEIDRPPEPSDKLLEQSVDDDCSKPSESIQVNEPMTDEPHSHVPIEDNLLGSIMLTFALGSHSVIEGLGFAMIEELGMVVNMLLTVLIHESVCAFSLGVNLSSKKATMKAAVILIFTFSVLIPAGIGIGLVVNFGIQKSFSEEIVTAILQGVAAGTFIYVVFMEIIPNEIMSRKDEWLKLILMALGFLVIAAMKTAHSHGEPFSQSNSTVPINVYTPEPKSSNH